MFRKSLLKCLLPGVAIAGAMALTGGANANLVGLLVENKTDALAKSKGLFVCNIYAVFSNAADRLLSVNSLNTSTNAAGGFYQVIHPFGTGPDGPPLQAEIDFGNPNVAYDSYVTIGRKTLDALNADGSSLGFGVDWAAAGGGFQGGSTMIGTWFVTPPTTASGLAGTYAQNPDGTYSVLVAQLTVTDDWQNPQSLTAGDLDVGWNDAGGATHLDTHHFEHGIPAPGALALLGVAGLLGMRRRRR